jgi:hypothetical protein
MMSGYGGYLEIAAHWAAILTFAGVFYGYCRYLRERRSKRLALENYLRDARDKSSDQSGKKGRHGIVHLMDKVGLTEAEILQASFDSKHVERFSVTEKGSDGVTRAVGLVFGYKD